MKKLISMMAVFALGLFALTGCSSGDKAAFETTVVGGAQKNPPENIVPRTQGEE